MTRMTDAAPAGTDRAMRRAAWTAVALLTAVNMMNYLDRMLIVLLAQPIKQQFGLNDARFSLLTGMAFVTVYSIAGVALARLADRISRKGVIAASLAAWSVMTMACGAAQSYAQLLVARAGVGIGEAGGIPAAYSIISSLFDPKRRVLPIAIFSAGSPIGILLCFLAGSAIFERWGWRATFLAAAVPGLLLALVILLCMREPARAAPVVAADAEEAPRTTAEAIRSLLGNRAYRWLIAGQAIAAFGSVGILQWLPLFVMRSHGATVGEVGRLFGPAIALGMTIGIFAGGWIGTLLSRHSLARSLHLCVWPTLLLMPIFWLALWLPSRDAAVAAIFAATLTGVISAPPFIAAMQEMCLPALRATAAAVSGILSSLVGSGLIPLGVGLLSDRLTPAHGADALRIALSASVGLFALGAWAFDRSRRAYLAQRTEAVPGA